MTRVPHVAAMGLAFLMAATTSAVGDAEPRVNASVEARYGSITAGPISGHVFALISNAAIRLGHELAAVVELPVVVSVVDEFSCCDVAAANASAALSWNRRSDATHVSAQIVGIAPTTTGRVKIAPALRLAERIEASRDADAYRRDALALAARASYGVRRGALWLHAHTGVRQRLSLASETEMTAAETHAELGADATADVGAVRLGVGWRGAVPLAGATARFVHGATASADRVLGAFAVRAELLLPLERELLQRSAFAISLTVARAW